MWIRVYFEMLCYASETDVGSAGCQAEGEQPVEVKIGALDVPFDWISPDLRANLEVKFSMQTAPSVYPKGIGGALEMTGGELDFQSLKITEFAAAIACLLYTTDASDELTRGQARIGRDHNQTTINITKRYQLSRK